MATAMPFVLSPSSCAIKALSELSLMFFTSLFTVISISNKKRDNFRNGTRGMRCNFSLRQHYLLQVLRVLSQSPGDTPKVESNLKK